MQSSDQNSRYEIWQPLLLALVLAGGMLLGTRLDDELPLISKYTYKKTEDPWEELKRVIGFIESRYGDSLQVDSISEDAIRLLVSRLDPHSYYLSGTDYLHFKERMKGSYIGIGIDYDIIRDTLVLLNVVPGGPAEQAGLRKGDQILAIDDQVVSGQGMTHQQTYLIWKESKRKLQLTVKNSQGIQTVEVERGPVTLYSVPVGAMVKDSIGYIKITRFASDTYREFMNHLEKLSDQGLRDLIIDVRQNPGGSLDQVIKILNQLVEERDKLLLYTEGFHSRKVEYKSTGRTFFPIRKIAVIINENSVSASEVLAGSLQDLDRAVIVGRRSFGKGLVQEMYDLSPRSAINLTVARYYLPSGRSIQRSYDDREGYDRELHDRITNGELFTEDSLMIHRKRSPEDLNGQFRPSGEGVVPDIFVAADSFYYSPVWKEYEHLVYSDAFDYYIQHQVQLRQVIEEGKSLDFFRTDILQRPVFSNKPELDSLQKRKMLDEYYHLIQWHHYGEASYYEKMITEDHEIKAAVKAIRKATN